jgi:hypothetical protein
MFDISWLPKNRIHDLTHKNGTIGDGSVVEIKIKI